jgi:hypothetical protein
MEQLIGLAGVLLGFALGAGWEYLRERKKRSRAKSFIRKELEANRTMIPQRIDLLTKMRQECTQARLLSGKGVGFMTAAFEQGMPVAYESFSILERDNLHFLYTYFNRTDEFMDTFIEDLTRMLETKGIKDPFRDYAKIIGDVIDNLKRTEELISRFLEGSPVDVLYRNQKVKTEPGKYL